MKTTLHFQQNFSRELPAHLESQDIRLSENVLAHFIEEYTSQGDAVFDPFAGFGTTLIVAEQLGRVGFGVELNEERHAYASSQIANPANLILEDVRNVEMNNFPQFSLSISSPTYMHKHEQIDPLTGFKQPGTYDSYLAELTSIYIRISHRLQRGGRLLIEAANLKGEHGVTPFAWDLCAHLEPYLEFDGEFVISWDQYGYGYDHSYCLVFSSPSSG